MVPTRRPPLFALRAVPPPAVARAVGLGAISLCLLLWWAFTLGATPESRLISPVVLPSPGEVLRSFPSLWTERALLESIAATLRSEEHTSELQSRPHLVCRLLLEKKKNAVMHAHVVSPCA